MKWAALFSACAVAAGSATAWAQDDLLEADLQRTTARFVEAVRACGIEPAFTPVAEVGNDPGVIVYHLRTRTVRIGRWEALPPPTQGFLEAWAEHEGSGLSGQALFERLFNGFLIGHELGHWLEHQSGRMETDDFYQGEMEANRIAIAFAALGEGGLDAAAAYVEDFDYLATLPNPVPDGDDPRAWFEANYDRISTSDPVAYSWFQGLMMRDAWSRRHEADFCGLATHQPR